MLITEVDMKHERERKEQESKKNQKLDFVSAGTQPGTVFAAQKPNIPIPGVFESQKVKNKRCQFGSLYISATSLHDLMDFQNLTNLSGIPALATSGLPSIPAEIAARDGRPNKKSKWDKVFYHIQMSRMRFLAYLVLR